MSKRSKPKRLNFTKAAIGSLRAPRRGREYTFDAKTPGLALCVTSTGTTTFYVNRRVEGRPERIRLGRYPAMTIDAARRRAAEVNAEIATGGNPQARKRTVRDETTFGELFKLYMAGHAKPHKRTWAEDQRLYDRHLSRWASRPVSLVTRADVTTLHARLGKTALYRANRLLALISTVFNFGVRHGLPDENPARRVKRFREHSRSRFLDADELRALFTALRQEANADLRDFFLIALLTGARRGNVQSMVWADIDLGRGLWRIPAKQAKSGDDMIVILSPEVVAILQGRSNDTRFVFPSSRSKSGHLVEPKAAWRRIIKRAGLTDIRLHDLRRTLGSWLASRGASLPVIGGALGHKSIQSTAVYARLDTNPIRQAVEATTAAMLTAGEGSDDGDN